MHQQRHPAPATADPSRQVWDTSYVPPKDRFAYFREGVCQTALALSLEAPTGQNLEARFERTDLPNGILSKMSATSLRVLRTKADLANIPDEFVCLTLQSQGHSTRILNDKQYCEGPGDSHLLDCNQVISVDVTGDKYWSSTNLIFKRSLIEPYMNLDSLFQFRHPSSKALGGVLRLISERHGASSRRELANLFDAALSLLIANMIRNVDYFDEQSFGDAATRSGILQAIKAYVDKNVADPDLATWNVAGHFGISTRYVQKLFAADGTTFKSYLTDARLKRIKDDLLDPAIVHMAASGIAARWGFRDMATFHRNFKQRFGDTPAQTRSLAKDGVRLRSQGPTAKKDGAASTPDGTALRRV